MRYIRGRLADVLEADGEALVLLQDAQVVRLSPIATVVLRLTAVPRDVRDLAGAIEKEFGPPEDGDTARALSALLAEMVAAGVLATEPDGRPEERRAWNG